jgi:integrase
VILAVVLVVSCVAILWLGKNGPLSTDGVYGMVKRRGARSGVELHPHSFRHTMSHNWLDAAGNEHDLMRRLMGWTNPKMVGRYSASTATERTLRAHPRLGPGDNVSADLRACNYICGYRLNRFDHSPLLSA